MREKQNPFVMLATVLFCDLLNCNEQQDCPGSVMHFQCSASNEERREVGRMLLTVTVSVVSVTVNAVNYLVPGTNCLRN